MEKILTEGMISSRIRFMLQDVIDLRLHNWVSTGPDQGQKNSDPSHKVPKIEDQEEPRQEQQQLLSKETQRQPDPSEQRDQGVQREEPGNTVPKEKNSRTTDPKKGQKVLKDLFKKVRIILDKQTPEKFDQLIKKLTDVTFDTEERLKGVVDLVFEKAIDEPSLSVAYGNMCSCLAELEVPISDEPNRTVSFIKLLLSRCQQEFEKDKDDDVSISMKQKKLDSAPRRDRHRLMQELQEAKDIFRRRSIGYLKFIGELFKLKKLKAPVMHDCVVKLLQNQDNVSLECLCSLLTIIGQDFDLEEAKPRMDRYFYEIKKIVREGKTCTRIRLMLQDVIDLRLHNWMSTGPDLEEPGKVQQQLLSKETQRQPDPSEQRDQGVQREEPGNTVPKEKNSRTTDPKKGPTFPEVINPWAQRPQPREIIVSLSVDQVVKQQTSENARRPGGNRESLPAELTFKGTQDLFKKVRIILDKRTPEKFDQLMKQVTDVTIDTEERLKGVVDLVFEKAIDEPSLSVAYGNMCSCLAELEVPIHDEPSRTVSFIKLLLSRCQQEFEKDKDDDVLISMKQKKLDSAPRRDRHRLMQELQEAKDIFRRRSIGYLKFIGELFKLKKLKAPVMHDCVVKLLQNQDNVSLECLCSLLTIIGQDFDLEEAKPRMDRYFYEIKKIVREGKTCTRIRLMLQDVIDLRLHNWMSTGPDLEEPGKVQQQLLSKETQRQPDPSEQRDQGVQREEPGNTVPKEKNSRTTDPKKGPTFPETEMDEDQVGSQAPVILVKASSEGAKASDSALQSSPSPRPSTAPPQKSDSDARTTLGSRSTGRKGRKRGKRGDKPLSAAPPLPQPGAQEDPGKDLDKEGVVSRIPSDTEEESEQERRVPEPEKPALSQEKIVLEDIANEEQTFECVKENLDESRLSLSPFMRELMSAVCEAAAKDNTKCRVDMALLQKSLPEFNYRNSDTKEQLHALHSLQALIVTLDQPPNLLRIFFDCMYDGDVISEDSFYYWGTSSRPEHLGKGVALKSLTSFFTWLREAEQESQEN
ncbi:eukaryotic translation initiation factor 4 gamma 3-like [Platichthys flesus]|uniref:eukaryotic translation initiation factor 4 gamma 3-like n=1 Tax=Platichthys flesus TaxID=8260 RepID=UPI002DBBCE49|nr:eukaryotic translation initiation factor 4 gamma 3-like [Platichthys flesus]